MASDDELLARIEAASSAGRDRDAALLARIEAGGKPAKPARDPNSSSGLGAYARGVVSSATGGMADEGRAWIYDKLGLGEYDSELAANREQFKADEDLHPVANIGGQVAGGVGAALGAAPVAAATGLTRLAGAAAPYVAPIAARINPLLAHVPGWLGTAARVSAGGAAGGAVTGFGEGEGGFTSRVGSAGEGALFGGAAGAALHGAAGVANRLLNPVRTQLDPEALRIRNVARTEGIPMSVAQETGSPWLKNVEGALAQLPGSAGMEATAQRAQNEAFSRATMRRAGENVDNATPPTLNASANRSGGEIGRIANTYDLDAGPPQFLNDLVTHSDAARRYAATDVERQTLSRIDDILGKVEAGDTIPGQAYRELRSEIGTAMRSTQDGDLIRHLRGVLDTLDNQFNAGLPPAEQAAFAQARREYANLHVVADAMGGAGAQVARGQVSPLRLQGAVDRSTGGGYAWGQGDLNDLARVGQDVLRNPPDSGTAGRTQANQLLTGSMSVGGAGAGFGIGGPVGAAVGAVAPYVLPSLAQSFLQSRAGRQWLIHGAGQIDPRLTNAGAVAAGSTAERNRLLQD